MIIAATAALQLPGFATMLLAFHFATSFASWISAERSPVCQADIATSPSAFIAFIDAAQIAMMLPG